MSEAIWLASYPPGVAAKIDPDTYPSLHALLLAACQRHRDRPAFDFLGATMSFAEWERASGAFAGFLLDGLGRKAGDRVALMLPNALAYPVAFLGTLRAGLTVVSVNPLYTPRELEHQLVDCGATTIVIMENFAHKLAAVIANTAVEHVVVARLGDLVPALKRWAFNFANSYLRKAVPAWRFERFSMLQDACNRPPPAALPDVHAIPDAPAVLQYTGGTTGVAKGAVLSHRNLVANTLQCHAWIGGSVDVGRERVLTPLPLYHIFSLTANMLTFACLGGLNVLVPDPRDIRRLIATMRRTRVTTMSGVNTLFNALANSPEFAQLDFGALKFAIGGGAAVQRSVADRWLAVTGSALVEGYGLTEASPVVCINPVSHPKVGTVGLPVPGTEVSVRDDLGRSLSLGETGEVWVRGPQVMQGYWGRPEETRNTLTDDRWLKTGDIGMIDPQGFVKLLDRKKDMIIVSGFKVFPNEVEEVVSRQPGVLEAAAIGVPDERSGQAVKLFVVRRDPALDEKEIRRFCVANLTGYKVPKLIEFRDELPKSNVGKILRKELH
ncbi:MAG TPA: AMP-binding protein [Xanthobacteraceae bacterium]|jgi:long-chain acyl-CoA synthetase|nr:AMP-binding protein [Xanthobacteraceae bacterium]